MEQKTLGNWEIGKQRPQPERLHDLARTLSINYEEEIYWLGLAGYIQSTIMPDDDQIEAILEIYYRDIQDYPFPAQILDYRNNYWAMNPATTAFFGGYDAAVSMMEKRIPNIFELVFRSELGIGNIFDNFENFRKQQIVLFILNNLHRRHEPFWQSYPQCWKDKFSLSDYQIFEVLWQEVCHEYLDGMKSSINLAEAVVNYSYVDLQTTDGKQIRFKVLVEAPVYFYHHIFDILRYTLVDEADRAEAERYFGEFWGKDVSNLKQWKVHSIKDILKSFRDNS